MLRHHILRNAGRLLVREPTLAEWVQNDEAGLSSSPVIENGNKTAGFRTNLLGAERPGAKRCPQGNLADLVPPAQRPRRQSVLQPTSIQNQSEPHRGRLPANASEAAAIENPQTTGARWAELQALSEAGVSREPDAAPSSPASRAVAGRPGMGVVRSPEQLFPDAARRRGTEVLPADNAPPHPPSPVSIIAQQACLWQVAAAGVYTG